MTFQQEIKKWLSYYKEASFSELEDGKWRKNGLSYSHILPEEYWFNNLLPEYRIELENYIRSRKIKRHPDFHHLNSSQAMCLNFFYPLIKEEKLQLIIQFLNLEDESVDYDSVCFEKPSKIESELGYRPTSFDFYFKTNNSKEIHFEIKFTEQEFGKAIHDTEHLDKYESVYKHHCSAINADYSNCNYFLNYYQLLRNVIHVSYNSYVVFLFPENNIKIKHQAEFAKTNLVKPAFQQNVINCTWESLIEFIDSINLGSQRLVKQMDDFKAKYKINCNSGIKV